MKYIFIYCCVCWLYELTRCLFWDHQKELDKAEKKCPGTKDELGLMYDAIGPDMFAVMWAACATFCIIIAPINVPIYLTRNLYESYRNT